MVRKPFELEIHEDPCPGLIVERGPEGVGVGDWVPNVKHKLLAKYVGAASSAMKRWPNRVFIDPFAGPGRIQVKGETITRDGGCMVASRAAMKSGAAYTHMLVGDLDAEKIAAAESRLRAIGASVQPFEGPADETVRKMVKAVPKGALCLAYIDPYNLSLLSFEMLSALARLPKIDFAIHFSTMDLSRNVDMQQDDERFRFDVVAPGWKTAVGGVSKKNLRVAFFNHWVELVKGLGFQFHEQTLKVSNDRGMEIYRLVFFTRHDLPMRLWGDVSKVDQTALDF